MGVVDVFGVGVGLPEFDGVGVALGIIVGVGAAGSVAVGCVSLVGEGEGVSVGFGEDCIVT